MKPASRKYLRSMALLIAFSALSSCVTPKQPPTATPPPVTTTAPTAAQRYRISSEQSMLHILVYRGGRLARLGHNHVITSTSISGEIWLHDALEQSGFDIEFPVNELIVDDAKARASEGADFTTQVSDDARAGTKRNMLKPELLDGEHFPSIKLQAAVITGTRDLANVTAQITIKDQTREVMLPVQLKLEQNTLHAKGEFDIRQTDFGIMPYSVMMGALQVLDQLKIKFELVALAE